LEDRITELDIKQKIFIETNILHMSDKTNEKQKRQLPLPVQEWMDDDMT